MEATAREAFGEHHPHESELIGMGLISRTARDRRPHPEDRQRDQNRSRHVAERREAENIRATLEQRGVVFFRGLDISDEQQVAIAKTLGNIVRTRARTASTRSRSTTRSTSAPST